LKCKSIIEIEKELRKEKHEKKERPFVLVARPGTKGHPFCPGLAFPVGKPGQQRFPNQDKSTFF
jgi:hypothetical protein